MSTILVLLLLPALSAGQNLMDPETMVEFGRWVSDHGREYDSVQEFAYRFEVFAKNKRLVDAHPDSSSYTLKLNQFADLTWSEFREHYLGASQNCSATQPRRTSFAILTNKTAGLPDSVDWRTKGVVTAVKNQGHCGSCWTFSTTGCLEAHHAIKTGKLVSLSEQNLIDCAQAFDNHGCNGGLPSKAFEYVRYNGGLDTEDAYPYQGQDEKCRFTTAGVGATVSSVVNITYQDEQELQAAIANAGPVSIAYQVASDFRFYHSGVYDSDVCKSGPEDVNHAVLAVGYDTDAKSGKDFWIVKNSWGTSFGIDGYFYIKRGSNMCGLADCASYPVV
mmetsp:Transcript_22247/g.31151  ORF Transcript_22247/g.31151 Transcript_22247/m.31151 type:complete len:333 (-) Transcript_22247:118-1116(-)